MPRYLPTLEAAFVAAYPANNFADAADLIGAATTDIERYFLRDFIAHWDAEHGTDGSRKYANQFRDFDNGIAFQTLLAAGYTDESWNNDTCPNATKGRCALFVDYVDPDLRECSADDDMLYTVIITTECGDYSEDSTSFADLPAAMQFVEEVNDEFTVQPSPGEAGMRARFRLQLSTIEDCNALIEEERLAVAPCSETIEHLQATICRRICERWIGAIGIGFHPDTRGADYTPAMQPEQVRNYNADMATLFALASDPYAIALEAMAPLIAESN